MLNHLYCDFRKFILVTLRTIASSIMFPNYSSDIQNGVKTFTAVHSVRRDHFKKPFTVFVEGNIGSGKTTFLNNFNDASVQIVPEPIKLWTNLDGHNLLGKLYEDPKRWGFLFQSYVQLSMLDSHTHQSHKPIKLMERSIHSARYCFAENLHRNNMMTDAELLVLDQWYKWITSHHNVEGDLIVYLRTDPEKVYERIKARERKEEDKVPLSYLEQLHTLHEKWLIEGTGLSKSSQVLVVDANQDLKTMMEEFVRLKSRIFSEHCTKTESIAA